MEGQTSVQREQLAHDLAMEEGRRRERVDGQLDRHEVRLNRINGSVEHMNESLRALAGKVEGLAEMMRTREKLDRQRAEALDAAKKGTVTRVQLWLAAAAIVAPQLYQLLQGSH
jgi:hypothetical protein